MRLEAFAVRRGFGGAGRWRGGNGAVRRILFSEPMTAVVVSSRRNIAPFGLAGGAEERSAVMGTSVEMAAVMW